MSSFVQPEFPRVHEGAARLTDSLERIQRALAYLRSPVGLVGVLVAAGLATVMVVAEQVVSALTDGHLLAVWVAMWAIVFGLLATFSDAISAWPAQLQARLQQRRANAAARAADERTWAAALADPRLMAELHCALLRAQETAIDQGQPLPQWPFTDARHNPAAALALLRN